jgi:hypothetical protein
VIHLIPEKTVHQRIPLKNPEKAVAAPSVQSTPPHTIAQSAQSNRFQSQLDATIHEQRLTHMQMQATPAKPQPSAGEGIPDHTGSYSTSEPVTEVPDDYFEEYYDEVLIPPHSNRTPPNSIRPSPCPPAVAHPGSPAPI